MARKLEEESGSRPAFVLEATGHYHLPLIQLDEAYNYVLIVLSTLIAQCAIFEVNFITERSSNRVNKEGWLSGLRHLTRHHEALTGMYVQVKLQFQTVLDQVLP